MAKNQDIKILTDTEHVLLRSGMYIGSTKPEKQLFWLPITKEGVLSLEKQELNYIPGEYKIFCEIVDNAIDEHIRGFGNEIEITYDKSDGFITVQDYGRGIPLDIHKEAGIPTPQVVYAQLRSGSNFDDSDRKTVGMNGVGAALTTIFSEKLVVEVFRDNQHYTQTFSDNLSKISKPSIKEWKRSSTGTKVSFKPDQKIFSIPIPDALIHKRCMELSYMFPKLSFTLKIQNFGEKTEETVYKGKNFEDFVKLVSDSYFIVDETKDGMRLAICENKKTEEFEQFSNVNGADTWRGGSHIEYVKDLICTDFKDKIWKENKIEVANSDVAKNLFLVLFLEWNAPQFEGQTKEKFVNDKKDISTFVDKLVSSRKVTQITNQLEGIKSETINDVSAKNDKKIMSELNKIQKTLSKKRIPKLIECSSKNRSDCSIYITEGDSAISNLATVRDAKTMAGLPLRGKIMNVFDCSPKDIIENKEIQSIIGSIGLKFNEDPFQTNKQGIVIRSDLNYGKIIIATDQDMDGYSIRCLLVNFFYKFWPSLFKNGAVYVLETPLYEALDKKNGSAHYFYNKEDFEKWYKDKVQSKYDVSYFKGLGSCGKEAWNYMINTSPNLVKITDGDAKLTHDKLSMAFGDDSDGRKKWLTE